MLAWLFWTSLDKLAIKTAAGNITNEAARRHRRR
jgi:hypothetical protein